MCSFLIKLRLFYANHKPLGTYKARKNYIIKYIRSEEIYLSKFCSDKPRIVFLGSSLYSNIQTINNDPWTLAPPTTGVTANSVDPWATVPSLTSQTPVSIAEENTSKQRSSTKTPESFLGENSSLVNLDNLLGTTNSNAKPGFYHTLFSILYGAKSYSYIANEKQDMIFKDTFR